MLQLIPRSIHSLKSLRSRLNAYMMHHHHHHPHRSASSGNANSERFNSGVHKIKLFKRLSSFVLFGGTFIFVLYARNKKRQDWVDILQQFRRLQGEKFGELELYKIDEFALPEPVVKIWKDITQFTFREDDVLLISFPKTGTTWLQEIVWLLMNGLDYSTAKSENISQRFPFLEFPSPGISSIEKLPVNCPRLIKTHLPPSLLLKDDSKMKPKVIFILRNPKDVLISYYHFARMNTMIGFHGHFSEFYERFMKGSIPYGSLTAHYLDAIQYSNQSNGNKVLIVFYEDLKKNFPNEIEKICEFLGVQRINEDQLKELESHCCFESMKENPAVNYSHWDDLGFRNKQETLFMRKGEIGDWKNYLNKEQNSQFDEIIKEKLEDKVKFIYDA